MSFPYNRIVNGFEAPPHSRPFQVYLSITRTSGSSFCGGSLISPRHVLTAAHCADSSPTSILVSVGDHNLTAPDGETLFQVSNIVVHPLWNRNSLTYDYAILTLNTPVVISPNTPFVGLVCLPPDVTQTFAGASLTSSGWGYTVGGVSASASSVLKAAYLRGMSDMDCSAAMVL